MKLASKQIAGFLKEPTRNCIGTLIYGPDEGQVREYAATLAKKIVADPSDPFCVAEISEDQLKSEPAKLADELFAFNMLGGARLVRLDADSETVGKLVAEIYGSETKPEAYLLIIGGDLPPRSALRQLFEQRADLASLPCYRDEGYQLDGMIQQAFREAKIQYEREVLDYLSSHMGNDRQVTRSELEKIVLYVGDSGKLTMEEAMALIGNSAELTLDDLSMAVADGSLRKVEEILHKLLREATAPVQIIRSLQRYFQRLHLMSCTMQRDRSSADQVIEAQKPKVFYKLVPVLRRQLGFWRRDVLEKALLLLTAAEKACKTSGAVPEAELQQAVMELMILRKRAGSNAAA